MNNLVEQELYTMDKPHVIKKVNEKIIAKHETIWKVQFQKLKKN
jgi:hypothetical protein